MVGKASTRILSFVVLVACTAFCQAKRHANFLPDAPSSLTASRPETFRSLMDTQSLPVNTLSAGAVHYDPGRFATDAADRVSSENAAQLSFLAKRPAIYHGSTSDTVLGRVGDAASSIILTRDEEGGRRLNTNYLLRVLTVSVAHSAYRPYWRRSAAQPISDFGSTVGSDAGMKVLHEFEPGLLQVMKNHEPRFVSKIEQHINRR